MGGVPTCSQTVGAPKKKKKDNGLQKKMVKLSVYGYYSICMYIYMYRVHSPGFHRDGLRGKSGGSPAPTQANGIEEALPLTLPSCGLAIRVALRQSHWQRWTRWSLGLSSPFFPTKSIGSQGLGNTIPRHSVYAIYADQLTPETTQCTHICHTTHLELPSNLLIP